ncbi:MAG: tetratricopeptide repeat protein [Acidobacteriota bacterium]
MLKDVANTLALTALMVVSTAAYGKDAHVLYWPRRSQLTPVQRLNREGVEAVRKHDYEKAERLFYKAYLYDPADPFTLNNLGYISEVEGQLERAQKFYDLAAEQGSNADIDLSNEKHLEGQPMKAALIDLKDVPMRVNRMNLDAMRLLSKNRGFEAVALLQSALTLEPQNAFTLNNLGVANEAIGDLDSALRDYDKAAALHSSAPAAVTLDRSYRGRSISSMARESAKRLERRRRSLDPAEAKAVMFTLQGVHAVNQNDWPAARAAFLHAYALDPSSAFCINNRGYVAEHDGDLETAQFFYAKARKAQDAAARVGLATTMAAEGQPLTVVATDSNDKVDTALDVYSQQRRQQGAPVGLTPRGPGAQQEEQNQTQPGAQPQQNPQ